MRELLLRAADWWLGTAIGGGLVLLAGYGLIRLARQPAARQRLGEYAVLAALIVAGLRLLPAWLPLPWAEVAAAEAGPNPPAPFPKREGGEDQRVFLEISPPSLLGKGAGGLGFSEPSDETTEPAAPFAWTWHDAAAGLMAAYLVVASALAARWLLGQWALNRLLRQARPAAPRVRRLFKAMAADTLGLLPRLRRRTHLRVARRLRAPVCFGLRRAAVLLPEPMDDAADAQLRWVFAHELTHLRRRDPWSSWGLGLAQAVYFFLPWFWWVKRSVRLCQEYVADAAAAKAGAAPDEYAEFLVSLARGSAPPLGATGLGSSSDLLRRVQMLLQSTTRVQGSWPRGRSMLAAGGLLAVAVLAGGVGLRAEPPKEETNRNENREWRLVGPGDKQLEVKVLSDMPVNYLKRLAGTSGNGIVLLDGDAAKAGGEPIRVVVRLADDGDEKKEDKDGKPGEKKVEKKAVRMTIVIDSGNGPVTIPLDGNATDMGKEIEKAMKKAHAQIDAAKKERAQATEKALNMLKGELTDDQLKQLQRHIEALRAQKGLGEVERVQAGKLAEEARALQDKAQAAVKLHQLQIERGMVPQGFGGALNLHDGQTTFMAMSHGSRLGAQVKKPSADLADQLDLPKDQGLVIVEVMKESAAAKAGLKANDIILELAGKPVSSDPGAFLRFVRELKGNEEVPAIVLRKGHKEKVTVKVPEPKKDGPVMDWQEGGLKKDFEFTPAIKPDGSGNFRWKIENARGPTAKAAKRDDGEKPVKIEKKEARQSRSVSIQVTDGKFVAEQKEDDVAIRATGTVNGDKMEMNEVTIVSPDGKAVYKKVADVPAKYRDSVKRLLSNTDGSPVRAKAVIIDK